MRLSMRIRMTRNTGLKTITKIFKFLNQCFARLQCWKKCLEITKPTFWINSYFSRTKVVQNTETNILNECIGNRKPSSKVYVANQIKTDQQLILRFNCSRENIYSVFRKKKPLQVCCVYPNTTLQLRYSGSHLHILVLIFDYQFYTRMLALVRTID